VYLPGHEEHEEVFVDDTARVAKGASIGPGTKLWHSTYVMSGALIGSHCSLGQNVHVAGGAKIGNNVKIQNNVSIYEGVTLEDYVFCGPSMVFTNVRAPRSAFPRNKSEDFLPTIVRYGASIGANATIVCGVAIGKWAFIAAGAVVARDVADYALIVGVPGKQIGWACECGIRLDVDGLNEVKCSACDRQYGLQAGSLVKLLTDHASDAA